MKPKIGDTVQFKKSGITGTVEKILRGACVVKTPTSMLSAWPEDLIVVGLSEVSLEKEMDEHQKLVDEIMAIQGIEPIEAEMEEVWHCPEGYIFKDENGNVINATKIVLEKKKKEYPKTYEECCDTLSVYSSEHASLVAARLGIPMNTFIRLLVARNAYWKIAGEEMGLNRPWEPSGNEDCFVISRSCGEVFLFESAGDNEPFEFPTREMRDTFYENFKELIEQCKELL